MDHITLELINAIEYLLKYPADGRNDRPNVWIFEEDSEVHLRLTEAVEQAKIALGILKPAFPEATPESALAHTERML